MPRNKQSRPSREFIRAYRYEMILEALQIILTDLGWFKNDLADFLEIDYDQLNKLLTRRHYPVDARLMRQVKRLYLRKYGMELSAIIKVILGFALAGIGFSLLMTGHLWSGAQDNMFWVIIGLTCIGVAELFIDPVVLSAINQSSPNQHRGFLTALYYLFVGAYANYLSIYVADLSVYLTGQTQQAASMGYIKEFGLVALACVAIIMILIVSRRWFQLDRL